MRLAMLAAAATGVAVVAVAVGAGAAPSDPRSVEPLVVPVGSGVTGLPDQPVRPAEPAATPWLTV